jgi:hypothetical protein
MEGVKGLGLFLKLDDIVDMSLALNKLGNRDLQIKILKNLDREVKT